MRPYPIHPNPWKLGQGSRTYSFMGYFTFYYIIRRYGLIRIMVYQCIQVYTYGLQFTQCFERR